MAESQEIGPWQDAWLRTLESGIFEQAQTALAHKDCRGNWRFCALGLACEVAIENGEKIRFYEKRDGASIFGHYNGYSGSLPYSVQSLFKFYSPQGYIESDHLPDDVRDELIKSHGRSFVIAGLNDSGVSFKEIAKLARKYPRAFFKEPA